MNISSVISQSSTSSALISFSKAGLPKNCNTVAQRYLIEKEADQEQEEVRVKGGRREKKHVADDTDISTSTGNKAKTNMSRLNTPPLTKGLRKGRS